VSSGVEEQARRIREGLVRWRERSWDENGLRAEAAEAKIERAHTDWVHGSREVSQSVQTRCSQWGVHQSPRIGAAAIPVPCDKCRSVIVTSETVAWRPEVFWHAVTTPEASPELAVLRARVEALREGLRVVTDICADVFNGSYRAAHVASAMTDIDRTARRVLEADAAPPGEESGDAQSASQTAGRSPEGEA
jgi:hypothetical protein